MIAIEMVWKGDIDEARYPQRVVLAVIGVDANRYQQWMKRGVLSNPRGDDALVGAMTSHPGRGRERMYSALAIIKLAAVARVTDLGVPVSLAVQLSGALEMALVAEDLQHIQDGTVPDTPMILTVRQPEVLWTDGETTIKTSAPSLEIHYWRPYPSLTGAYAQAEAERPLLDGVPAGIILDWRSIVQSTLKRLAEVTAGDEP